MTDRLRQVKEQLDTAGQLEVVMNAMQGIASSRLREANTQLNGIRSYAHTIARAIGQVMAMHPDESMELSNRDTKTSSELVVVITAEQGFAGAFNERIFDALDLHLAAADNPAILLVGSRGQSVAQERKLPILDAIAMATRVEAIPALAITVADLIYARIGSEHFDRVTLLYPEYSTVGELSVATKSLIPFDYSRFTAINRTVPPIITLAPDRLSSQLAQEYVFAEICSALMLSHAAENEARVRAMVRARSNVVSTRKELQGHYQQLRQDQITAEITELTTGRLAGSRSIR